MQLGNTDSNVAQAQRHAPGLKVAVYDGVSRKALDEPADGKKKRKRKNFKKMSREERFKTSAVCHSSGQMCKLISPELSHSLLGASVRPFNVSMAGQTARPTIW